MVLKKLTIRQRKVMLKKLWSNNNSRMGCLSVISLILCIVFAATVTTIGSGFICLMLAILSFAFFLGFVVAAVLCFVGSFSEKDIYL